MSNEENPFADPNDVNPFASQPSYNQQQQAAQPTTTDVNEYNPFAEQSQTQTKSPVSPPRPPQPVFVPTQQRVTPATIEPIRSEPKYKTEQLPVSSSGGYGTNTNQMKLRQEELEKKAAELEKKELELRSMQGTVVREKNFPPIPKCCKINPCFYHDISVDIPIESQQICKMMFYTWELYVFTLMFNFLSALSGLCVGLDGGAILFGVALLYLVLFTPCSFLLWYRPIYRALKSNSSFNFMLFFFVFFFQIIFSVLYAFGISSLGTCGWINGASLLSKKESGVAAMFFICGALFLLLGILQAVLLRKIHAKYRGSGASFEKAQKEFVTDVASNKNVQNAAADALKAGVSSQRTKY